MNYPVWQLEMGGGLLIALVAVTHVFVSHFAVGGGLFLVVAERRAYREGDAGLLAWLRRHAKFFALLTLVFGGVSGVGIWFTIGLVHPAATSALIHVFVWGWAIEWIFFFVEIAAAVIYAATWDRLDRRTHLAVGWIYFAAAFMSLVVINGILAFMFSPGAWLDPATRSFWTGFFNPTYFPQLLVRALAAVAFAGLYVFATAWREPLDRRAGLARYAALWALPATLAGPLAAVLYLQAAPGALEVVRGAVPSAAHAFRLVLACAVGYGLLLAAVALLARRRPGLVSLPVGVALLLLGYGSIAGAEFVRESIRKPYVIGNPSAGYLYVSGLTPADAARTQASGLLAEARWVKGRDGAPVAGAERGAEVFRVACRGCHSVDGYRPVRRYVDHKPVAAIATLLGRLDKLRGRMPAFPGTAEEARDLALYLGGLDGELEPQEPVAGGGARLADVKALLQDKCLACHDLDPKGSNPLRPKLRGWSATVAYEKLGKLSQLNAGMMGMDVTDEAERKALAGYLATLAAEE